MTSPDPTIAKQAEQDTEEASTALQVVKEWPDITTAEQFEIACDTLREVKGQYKTLEAKEETITKPLWQAWKATKELFKPAKDHLVAAERLLKQKVAVYTNAQKAAALEAMQTQAAIIPAPAEPTKGISVRQVRKWEVFEPDKVPRDYCSPDQAKIQAAIDAGDTAIPGVRFYMADQVSVRT